MDSFVSVQGDPNSCLTPLILVHAVSGLALPYFGLGSLTGEDVEFDEGRPVYGISSPIYSSSGYRLPHSLDHVANEYITMITRHLRSKGPFILGGWSLGGMIAMKMEKIMRSRGMEVLRVIMIDSANPDRYPAFTDKLEHQTMAALTFNPIKQRLSFSVAHDMAEEAMNFSSEDEFFEDDGDDMSNMLPRIYQHIYNGLELISKKDESLPNDRCQTPVSLIKCSIMGPLPKTIFEPRRKVMKKRFEDQRMGWQEENFDDFETIQFGGSHDGAFDVMHVGELTLLMREILNRCG
ncbi:hypothetical protein V494_01547 [Pseudogymnoascus sp. VKM F-4513 (FW-928)]|nr:hypothetical protein V494_01547 [Pseudogymnoascus sp. VKM F-4513 (FW-928)]